jgi:hypothetical protein
MAVPRQPGQHFGLVAHLCVDRVDQLDRGLLAGIVAAPGNHEPLQPLRRDPQPHRDRRLQVLGGMVQRQGKIGKADHPPPFAANSAKGKRS